VSDAEARRRGRVTGFRWRSDSRRRALPLRGTDSWLEVPRQLCQQLVDDSQLEHRFGRIAGRGQDGEVWQSAEEVRTSHDLPIPGSPWITTVWCSPERTLSANSDRREISTERPTKPSPAGAAQCHVPWRLTP